MHDSGQVHDLQGLRDAAQVLERLHHRDRVLQPRLQVSAREIFHRDVFTAIEHAVVEDVDDRGWRSAPMAEYSCAKLLCSASGLRVTFSATVRPSDALSARYTVARVDSPSRCSSV